MKPEVMSSQPGFPEVDSPRHPPRYCLAIGLGEIGSSISPPHITHHILIINHIVIVFHLVIHSVLI